MYNQGLKHREVETSYRFGTFVSVPLIQDDLERPSCHLCIVPLHGVCRAIAMIHQSDPSETTTCPTT